MTRRITIRLTKAQRDVLVACVTLVDAGEWPFPEHRPETLERAVDALYQREPDKLKGSRR